MVTECLSGPVETEDEEGARVLMVCSVLRLQAKTPIMGDIQALNDKRSRKAQLALFLHLELPVHRSPWFQMVELGVGLEHLVRLGKTVALPSITDGSEREAAIGRTAVDLALENTTGS